MPLTQSSVHFRHCIPLLSLQLPIHWYRKLLCLTGPFSIFGHSTDVFFIFALHNSTLEMSRRAGRLKCMEKSENQTLKLKYFQDSTLPGAHSVCVSSSINHLYLFFFPALYRSMTASIALLPSPLNDETNPQFSLYAQ